MSEIHFTLFHLQYSKYMYMYFSRPAKPVPLVLDSEGKAELPMAVRAPTLMVGAHLICSHAGLQLLTQFN